MKLFTIISLTILLQNQFSIIHLTHSIYKYKTQHDKITHKIDSSKWIPSKVSMQLKSVPASTQQIEMEPAQKNMKF